MNNNFFGKNIDFKYPEIAICCEDSNNSKAKFIIPIITPTLPTNILYDNKNLLISTDNIISDKKNINITPCMESNYIELDLPDNIIAKKGDKFVVIFIGGDVNNPMILTKYNKKE